MKQIIISFLAVIVAGVLAGCAHAPSSGELYTLTVELNTPYNQKFKMETVIALNEPFELTKPNGEIKNTISGVLRKPVDGKFPLELTVSEWKSERSNLKDTTELNLELGKAWSGGPVSSFVYGRTVTLSKSKRQGMQNN